MVDTVWTMRELQLADILNKPFVPVWHSGPYPPNAVATFLAGTHRIPSGSADMRSVALEHVLTELMNALQRVGVTPSATVTTATSA